jgi:class II lanthipeptide synthase
VTSAGKLPHMPSNPRHYRAQLESAIQAIALHSPYTFSWFGKRRPRVPTRVLRTMSVSTLRLHMVSILSGHLYYYFYCKGYPQPMHWELARPGAQTSSARLLEALSKANAGIERWDDGWTVEDCEAPNVIVSKNGLTLTVSRRDVDAADRITGLTRVRLTKEYRERSPGFYFAVGDSAWRDSDSDDIVRVYWNSTPRGALRLMDNLTTALNRGAIPFQFKTLHDPAAFDRCDTAVLYLPKRSFELVKGTLVSVYGRLREELRPGTPAFTKMLAPQVALAEDPGDGSSFGMHRCKLMADALVSAHEHAMRSLEERTDHVVAHFAAAGVRVIDEPYLRAGSDDDYSLEWWAPSPARYRRASEGRSQRHESLPEHASLIGRRLCEDALWHGARCTWIGSNRPEREQSTCATLGPDLYAGTSGVALFLADLYAVTEEPELARVALGAVRQALERVEAVPRQRRAGLFDGWSGVALVTARVAGILQHAGLRQQARQLFERAIAQRHSPHQLDLMSGNAGIILCALALHRMFDDDNELLTVAAELGEELLEKAVELEDGLSWDTINRKDQYHLTGFSHGTAGVSHSLLNLYASTGDARFRHAAEMGFNYERAWFDPELGNWPDLRETTKQKRRPRHALAFSTYWCHGAPGIALSRLRAHVLLEDPRYLAEALTALECTRSMVDASLNATHTNFSLCHGLAGNAEILRLGSRQLGNGYPEGIQIARRVAALGIETYGSSHMSWPLGTPSYSPGLMLGLAGVGHALVCLHCPETPSVLLIDDVTSVEPVAAKVASTQRSTVTTNVNGGRECRA